MTSNIEEHWCYFLLKNNIIAHFKSSCQYFIPPVLHVNLIFSGFLHFSKFVVSFMDLNSSECISYITLILLNPKCSLKLVISGWIFIFLCLCFSFHIFPRTREDYNSVLRTFICHIITFHISIFTFYLSLYWQFHNCQRFIYIEIFTCTFYQSLLFNIMHISYFYGMSNLHMTCGSLNYDLMTQYTIIRHYIGELALGSTMEIFPHTCGGEVFSSKYGLQQTEMF